MEPLQAAQAFDLPAPVTEVTPLGRGLINQTYLVTTGAGGRAVLQRLNPRVFPRPEAVMANLRVVLTHLATRTAPARPLVFPTLVPTRAGADWLADPGGPWRMLSYIPGRSLTRCPGPEAAAAAGAALGRFHRLVADLEPVRLQPVLRGFHDTPRCLEALTEQVAGRRLGPAAREAWSFIAQRREAVAEFARARNGLASQVIHGDPKFDNFLFDRDGKRVLGLVDLDTLQAAPRLLDVADALRSACNPAGEDPADLTEARFEPDWCRAWLAAYQGEGPLPAADRRWLYGAVRLVPLELAMRFLADHLAGDVYFKTTRPGQNLHRARVQLRLVACIENDKEALLDAAAGLE